MWRGVAGGRLSFTPKFNLLRRTQSRSMTRHRGPKKPQAAKKPPLTHFLCVPLVTPKSRETLEASMKRFSDAVSQSGESAVETANIDGETGHQGLRFVHPKAIRPVGAIHLTLGVMSLDKDQLSEAEAYLNSDDVRNLISATVNRSLADEANTPQIAASEASSSLERTITPPATERVKGPLEVQLSGVQSMHAAHKTSILYIAPTDESNRLYPFCVALQKLFRDKGFLLEDNRQLKLHATIVNTIYAKERRRPTRPSSAVVPSGGTSMSKDDETEIDKGQGSGQRSAEQVASSRIIDATSILKAFEDFVWADGVVLDRVAICEMGAKKIFDKDGMEIGAEYAEVASVSLPT